MTLSNQLMMKAFLAGTAGSMMAFGVVEAFGVKRKLEPSIPLGAAFKYGGNIVGGALIGIGMTLGGACPGTAMAQLGAGLTSAPYVLAGGIVGALVFAYTLPVLRRRFPGYLVTPPTERGKSVDLMFNIPHFPLAVACSVLLMSISVRL